jgi:glutamate---cysteine ligase / carboxylate-amine ligase
MMNVAILDNPTDKKNRQLDELAFQPSPQTTLGVELELQILDKETGDLAPGAVPIIKACQQDNVPGVSAELMQSMIEIKTGVCANVADVKLQLLPGLRRVHNIAGSLGYDLAMLGTHPFHRTTTSVVYPDERYERIQDRLAWLTYQRVVFGLHIHVGVPSGDLALGVINTLVQKLPHLLALSGNSPFWQGVDTGLASCRSALYRMLPQAGVPRYFPNWKDFRSYCHVMKDCKAINSFKDIYWDIRPRPDFGTIEFRICDMPPSLPVVLGIAAMTRALVDQSLQLLAERPLLRRGDIRRHWVAVENKWLATRYGLAAVYIRSPSGKRRSLVLEIDDMIDRLVPIARESGDHVFLNVFKPMDRYESGAARQRRLYRENGSPRELIRDSVERFREDVGAANLAPVK